MKTNITHFVCRQPRFRRVETVQWVGLVRCEGTELKYGLAIGSIVSFLRGDESLPTFTSEDVYFASF